MDRLRSSLLQTLPLPPPWHAGWEDVRKSEEYAREQLEQFLLTQPGAPYWRVQAVRLRLARRPGFMPAFVRQHTVRIDADCLTRSDLINVVKQLLVMTTGGSST